MSELTWRVAGIAGYALLALLGFLRLHARHRDRRALQAAYLCACAALLVAGLCLFLPTRATVGHWLLMPVLTLISAEDIEDHRISNKLLIALLALGVAAALLRDGLRVSALVAPLLYGAVFVLVSLVSRGSFGMGDAKLIAVISTFYGLTAMFTVLFLASIAACLCSILVLIQTKNLRSEIAFAPALELGAIVALIWFA